jgi:hypothetical protein
MARRFQDSLILFLDWTPGLWIRIILMQIQIRAHLPKTMRIHAETDSEP